MARSPSADTLLNRFVVKAKFRHMQVLLKLAELGSMRRTAQAVNMTQPAVSQLVSELERLLQTQLFFRHARGVEPTEATRDLLPVAQRVLDAIAEGSEAVANRLNENDGVVRVAASPAAIGGLLHGVLDRFARQHPGIQLHLTETDGSQPAGGISGDRADIICIREPPIKAEGWVFDHCFDDMLIAVCGDRHPFASLKQVHPDMLGEAKWLLNRVGSVARKRFEDLAVENDWPESARCQIIMHIPDLTREMLLTGKYLAILPRSVAIPWLGSGRIKELDTDVTTALAPLGILWRPDKAGPATTTFAKYLVSRVVDADRRARALNVTT